MTDRIQPPPKVGEKGNPLAARNRYAGFFGSGLRLHCVLMEINAMKNKATYKTQNNLSEQIHRKAIDLLEVARHTTF